MCLTLRHVGYVEARVARLNPKNERSPIVAALHLTMRNLAVGAAGRGQQHVLLVRLRIIEASRAPPSL